MKTVGFVGLTCLLFSFGLSSGCAYKLQQRVIDQDQEIVELRGRIQQLESRIKDLSQENKDLLAQRKKLWEENKRLRESKKQVKEASFKNRDGYFAALRRELGKDATVGIRHNMLSIGISSTVTFKPGSTSISREGARVLRRVAKVLRTRFPGRWIYVAGHTDNQPIRKTKKLYRSNRHLSLERADKVASFLVKCGVSGKRIAVLGFGENDPVAPNTSEKGRRLNRRVEILIGSEKKD